MHLLLSSNHAFLPTTPPCALFLSYAAVFETWGNTFYIQRFQNSASVFVIKGCHLLGVGVKETLHYIWPIQGVGEIISMEQALPTGKTVFNAQWAPEKQGWNQGVWVTAVGAKGESAFYNCFSSSNLEIL